MERILKPCADDSIAMAAKHGSVLIATMMMSIAYTIGTGD